MVDRQKALLMVLLALLIYPNDIFGEYLYPFRAIRVYSRMRLERTKKIGRSVSRVNRATIAKIASTRDHAWREEAYAWACGDFSQKKRRLIQRNPSQRVQNCPTEPRDISTTSRERERERM